jgi:twitching motility protein PilT
VATPAIRNLIRTKQSEQIPAYLEAGGEYGMHTMDSSLIKLVQDGIIDREIAVGYAKNKERFQYL